MMLVNRWYSGSVGGNNNDCEYDGDENDGGCISANKIKQLFKPLVWSVSGPVFSDVAV